MKILVVNKKYDGKKLNNFILDSFPNLSKNTLFKALRKKDIKINDKRVSDNVTIFENDEIKVFISDALLEGKLDIDKIYEDDNILIGIYSGLLIRGLNFQNSIIKSQDELITNLRMFIPTKIQKKQKNQKITYGFNLDDKILTNSININFHKNYIIALTGFNNIENVKNSNGNYLIYHDGEINNEERYIAAVVKKIEGNPQILFSPQI